MTEDEHHRLLLDFGDLSVTTLSGTRYGPPLGRTPDGKPFTAWKLGPGVYKLRDLTWFSLER